MCGNRICSKGFSLVELMVTMSIIGVLATVAIPNYENYLLKTKYAEAKTHIAVIIIGIHSMYAETLRAPYGIQVNSSCQHNQEVHDIRLCSVGLFCNDGNFANWQGPYYDGPALDPWGRPYYIDFDFTFSGYPDPFHAVASRGSDGIQQYLNSSGSNDEVAIKFCFD